MQVEKSIGLAMLGHGKMGRIHSDACRRIEYIYAESNIKPKLITIIGRDEERVKKVAAKYGYNNSTVKWRDAVIDPKVTIFDNVGPNHMHSEPTIAAAQNGKHIFCEKPLARTSEEAYKMLQAAKESNVKHMCGFHFRFIPAVRLMKEIIKGGEIGEILQIRARYLQGWLLTKERTDTWRFDSKKAGTGVLGDLGSHLIDVARYLIDEFSWISTTTENFWEHQISKSNQECKVDDVFIAIFQFKNGALGTMEASRLAHGRENHAVIEVNGTKGSLLFNMERLNELQISDGLPSSDRRGFRTIFITDLKHPFGNKSLGNGHIIGWDYVFVHELHHFFNSVKNDKEVGPDGATFLDGYRCAEILDAALASAEAKKQIPIQYKV